MKIHVGIVIVSLPPKSGKMGGVVAAVDRLAATLNQRGNVEITVFCQTEPPPDTPYPWVRIVPRKRAVWNGQRTMRVMSSPENTRMLIVRPSASLPPGIKNTANDGSHLIPSS